MKILTLQQPWATLAATGAKKIETRNWSTPHRGKLAIHASKQPTGRRFEAIQELCRDDPYYDALTAYRTGEWCEATFNLPSGVILAVCDLVECRYTGRGRKHPHFGFVWDGDPPPWVCELSEDEDAFGDFGPERWGWFLENVRPLPEPIPARGQLGLWDFDVERYL